MTQIAVIGAGITGVTTAYALARRGASVTLIEQQRYPAMETSFANGGQLSASNAEVWMHRTMILKGLRWMLRKDAPLLVNPIPGWHKLSWFAEFLAAMPHYRDHTQRSVQLALAAREYLYAWAEEAGIEFDLRREGILHLYRQREDFERARQVNQLLNEAGLERHAVTPAEMKTLEPALTEPYYGGFYTASDASGDIHKFTCALAQAAADRGVESCFNTRVQRISADGVAVELWLEQGNERQRRCFDQVVICAGTASRALAAQLGDRVNVYPVKGYSLTLTLEDLPSQAAAPRISLLDEEFKLVCSRFGDTRLRVAGTAEFNGFNRDIRAARIEPLVRWVERCFPQVNTRQRVPWAGLRPMMPDMMPRVGPGSRPGVFYNTGHGHLGWTLSAITAEMVAAQMEAPEGS